MPEFLAPLAGPQDWTPERARHLLSRAGFGRPLSLAGKLAAMTPEAAVASLLDFGPMPEDLPDPDFLPKPLDFANLRRRASGLDEEGRKALRQEFMQEQRQAVEALQDWWIRRLLRPAHPLQEKLVLFWHGHFATSAQKVKNARANWDLWKIFHRHAAGNFRELTAAVGKSPAMLAYLDNNQNRKGHPNENWARELMELFTLGRGNYTENDIRESARAFSGWTLRDETSVFNPKQHDDGTKTFLGEKGRFQFDDVIGIIFRQPAAARFIAKKLWEFFAYENPEEGLIDALAKVLREAKYELKPALRAMFLSQEFYSRRAVGTQVASPVQLVVGLLRGLEVELADLRPVRMALRGLGQDLFHPPNVKGWPGNRAWIDTNTLLLRYNVAGALVNGVEGEGRVDRQAGKGKKEPLPRRLRTPFDVNVFLDGVRGTTVDEVVNGAGEALLGRTPDAAQRVELLKALKRKPGDAFLPAKIGEEALCAMVHLLLGLPESQLC